MTTATSPSTAASPLAALARHGQSVWFDFLHRAMLDDGELAALVERHGVTGVTTNPAIFEKAIAGSADYAEGLAQERAGGATDAATVYERLAVADVRRAADVLRPVYERTDARDGYVSLEVSPTLARDTEGTLAEARRLWSAVGRPNLMVKVPATAEGMPAIRRLIAEGINVNVTLLFSEGAYLDAAEAHLSGLEDRARAGKDVSRVASVASFFVSRVDTAVDAALDDLARRGDEADGRARAASLRGKAAVANARIAYDALRRTLASRRWAALAARGAQPQRLLWASTGTKDPAYRDTYYVEELIGPHTVDTMPPATLAAFADHGTARLSVTEGVEEARETLARLGRLGIDLNDVTTRLLGEGLAQFQGAFARLLAAVAARIGAPSSAPPWPQARLSASLPPALEAAVGGILADWAAGDKSRRLWERDATLWTGRDEGQWLGWLTVVDRQRSRVGELASFAEEVRREGFRHVLLLGMGGSSLCPEVWSATFGRREGYPELLVLDSTDPAQVASFEARVDLERTLFVVSSKSGGTLEPNLLLAYFLDRIAARLGRPQAGRRFVAITDPGSALEAAAKEHGFRRVFHGLPSIGGRYSALSDFGLVPAALMGLDVGRLLERAAAMAAACGPKAMPASSPGVVLGAILGAAARSGRDKVTLVASADVARLGAWLEQLLAESTGKEGKAVLPVDGEALGAPEAYGSDRVFVRIATPGGPDDRAGTRLDALAAAGHPVVRIPVADGYDLAAEMFRWEVATAVAGAVLGIHPFDQPDVEAAKVAARRLTAAYDATGRLPAEAPFLEDRGIALHADPRHRARLEAAPHGAASLASALRGHLGLARPGDYLALLAYLPMTEGHAARLGEARLLVRDRLGIATCVGFGPRFLHSTGQAYKGGPNTALVLQITCDDAADLPVPGRRASFGVVKAAQARGDLDVLVERGRRVLRVHLGADVGAGLDTLVAALREALA